MADLEWIVGEVSKNWDCKEEARPPMVSQLFEKMIARNNERGFVLHSFQLHRLCTSPTSMNETIIAVFCKRK